jgi:nitroreductase/ketosteroid isomerase-like protein
MRRKKINTALFLIFFITACYLSALPDNRPGLSLKETFDIYVEAVQNSDLKTLFTTVSDREEFFFLTSKGKLIGTRQDYYSFHKDWFKETGWQMPVDFLEAHEGKDYGYTTAVFHYKSKLPEGRMYHLDSYFTLIFRKEEGMWKVVADICTPINHYYTEDNGKTEYTSDQTFLFSVIKNRRTVRKFMPTPVPKGHVLKILDAAYAAPTAGNQQPWKFLVIEDREKLETLQKEALLWFLERYQHRRNPTPEQFRQAQKKVEDVLEDVLSAPVYVAVLVDSEAEYGDYVLYDGILAAGYLMIAARALGYGTGFYTTFFPEEKMKIFFHIPQKYKLICFTPIGIPSKWPEAPPKKDLEDMVIFESFSENNGRKGD